MKSFLKDCCLHIICGSLQAYIQACATRPFTSMPDDDVSHPQRPTVALRPLRHLHFNCQGRVHSDHRKRAEAFRKHHCPADPFYGTFCAR
eukprot:COSAG06_NODE_3285_length_5555_cov_489.949597_5_plen_90_part_00